ncbi:MAG: hypothetical protein WCO96_02180 [Actinomycetes bacterium]
MSQSEQPTKTAAPPVGEEIHLPGPTGIPLLTAVAVTMIVIGTTLSWLISAVGAIILVFCLWRWIGDSRRSMSELPEPKAPGDAEA